MEGSSSDTEAGVLGNGSSRKSGQATVFAKWLDCDSVEHYEGGCSASGASGHVERVADGNEGGWGWSSGLEVADCERVTLQSRATGRALAGL
eukprot:CAMPEP_0174841730 /NCGR_PEP_ID=MMETSP1114-20130205/9498_1 /TAXON_ID=312471 /ORGANISM="Neobodo designis, Strain CCAP 1951/1" /LENGTH=91 /DNA_ID=CAMNT_0016075923 /DNA_START=783 /DNA_END=1059 /DNA_ORIENTATION=-